MSIIRKAVDSVTPRIKGKHLLKGGHTLNATHTVRVDPETLKAAGKAAKIVGGGLAIGGTAVGTGHVLRGRNDAKKNKVAQIASEAR